MKPTIVQSLQKIESIHGRVDYLKASQLKDVWGSWSKIDSICALYRTIKLTFLFKKCIETGALTYILSLTKLLTNIIRDVQTLF